MPEKPSNKIIQAWIQLHRVQRRLLDAVDKNLKQEGLPPLVWYDVLLELDRAKNTGLRQYEIGNKILLNKHNLSRLIDRLEKKRLLVRYESEEDGRGNLVKITRNGEIILKQIWPVYSQSIQDNFGDKLTSRETEELSNLLNKILVD